MQTSQLTACALLLSSDSLVAGLVTGSVLRRWRWRVGLAVLFGACDGASTICGALMPHALPTLSHVCLYGLCVILVTLAARRSVSWLLLLPFLLAVDNLSSGVPVDAAPAMAAASAGLALIGMLVSASAISALRSARQRQPLEALSTPV
jgi:hypothetical protein